MVFNSWQPTPFPNPLMMRAIVSVLLSRVDSESRFWGNWCITIRPMSLLSAASPTLIELTDWSSAVRGTCLALSTRRVQLFKSSEMPGGSRASERSNRDAHSAFSIVHPARHLVPHPCTHPPHRPQLPPSTIPH